jgi:hypothetical protein
VIAPLGHRLRKGSKLLYRQPAFLICTDPEISVEEYLQAYLWRWGIEVNFRDEKSLLGTGQAQVRTEASNRNQPACSVAAYALLWTAALQLGLDKLGQLPRPKWRKARAAGRTSTGELLRTVRWEQWAGQMNAKSFCDFMTAPPAETSEPKVQPSLPHALLAAA